MKSSGFCQGFQRFAVGCCRVIKVFDKKKSDHNGSDVNVIAILPESIEIDSGLAKWFWKIPPASCPL